MEDLRNAVREHMSQFDGSHDWSHVVRVVNLALYVARHVSRRNPVDMQLVEVSALMHDMQDHKYASPKDNTAAADDVVTKLLVLHLDMPPDRIDKVKRIINGVSYTNETVHGFVPQDDVRRETYIVRDADRLDAMGATGLGRAFAYGAGARKGTLVSVIDHAEDKLVKLYSLLKTECGRKLGVARHKFTRAFITEFKKEQAVDRDDHDDHDGDQGAAPGAGTVAESSGGALELTSEVVL